MIIGITGKSGVGKSTYACQIAKENSFRVVHIDDIAHEIMELPTIKELLINKFGNEVIKNGVVDRKYLGDLVFENRHLYEELSVPIWNMMKYRINLILSTHENVILDWLLLPHTHYWNMCDKKILVVANEADRVARVMARDNITAEYLNKRDAAGMNYDNIEFDEVIETKGVIL